MYDSVLSVFHDIITAQTKLKNVEQDDSATSTWLVQFTKDCPKCKVAINKDGGCNHMHCKQCDHHFCWVCLGKRGELAYPYVWTHTHTDKHNIRVRVCVCVCVLDLCV